jgi:hypothetical protein
VPATFTVRANTSSAISPDETTMNSRRRNQARPDLIDNLETRCLLATGQILGNAGEIISSQFQPLGFKTIVGAQFRGLTSRGPIKVHVVTPGSSA